ncbi:MAG: hypothetical protein HOW73_09905 [Polyangiaceae bacterium]|nr:hypothetical protein [Polyangiaceae bacterium]
MQKLALLVLSAFAFLFVSSAASAATKSFTAATANLPSDIEVLGTSNLKSVRSTETFKKVFPELLKMGGKFGDGIDKVKKECGIDPVTAFDDATVGVGAKDEGAIFIAMNGVTEQKLLDCVSKIAKSSNKATVSSKKTGSITEVKNDKSGDTLYFAWLTGDVLVVATDPDNKALLEKMTGGKGGLSKSKVGGRIGKLDSNAALSVVWGKQLPVDKMTVRNGELTLAASGGNLTATTTVEMGSQKEAEQVAAAANAISAFVNVPKGAPKEVDRILKTLSAKSSGAEVKISAQSTERDLAVVLGWALKQAAGF